MATATITDERTTVNSCDTTSGWAATNTVGVFTSEPTPIEGTGCLGMQVSTATHHAFFASTARDLSDSLVYVWIFHRAELDTTANGGIMIHLGDGTNRVGFHIAGSDVDGFRYGQGPVGWQCVVLDGSTLPTAFTVFAGTRAGLNISSITQIGVGFKTLVKSVGGVANCFWDMIRVGAPGMGIIVTGGTSIDPLTMDNIALADRQTGAGRAHGIVRRLGTGLYGLQGTVKLGAAAGAVNTFFKDQDVTLVYEDRGLASNKYGLTFQSSSINTTSIQFGIKTGTGDSSVGSNGATFICPTTTSANLFTSGFVNNLLLYGCSFTGFGQGCALGSNALVTELVNTSFTECAMVYPAEQAFIRNCSFSGYTPAPFSDTQGALYFPIVGLNIKNSSFTSNTNAVDYAGVYVDIIGTYSFDGLSFSSNDYDIRNASGGLVTVNATNGSDPATFINDGGSTTVINNPVTFTVSNVIDDSEVRLFLQSDTSELGGVEGVGTVPDSPVNVSVSSDPDNAGRYRVIYQYNYSVDLPIFVVIFNQQYSPLYVPVTLRNQGSSLTAFQIFDRQYDSGSI